MSTHGAFGFPEGKKLHLVYVGYDAYPDTFIKDIRFIVKALGWSKVKKEIMTNPMGYESVCHAGNLISNFIAGEPDRKVKMHLHDFWKEISILQRGTIGTPMHPGARTEVITSIDMAMDYYGVSYIYIIKNGKIHYNKTYRGGIDSIASLQPEPEMSKKWLLGRLIELT